MNDSVTAIGRVIGTEKKPNTAYTFYFWSNLDAPLGIGSVIRVASPSCTVYGTVVEVHGFNDLESPLHEYLAYSGEAHTAATAPTDRPEMRVYLANVLRREPEEPISAVPIGDVFMATEPDLQKALHTDSFAATHGIPAGCYGSRSEPMAVHLHSSFLLGPESGHLNMTGTSGLAAKTSFILFLLQSTFQFAKDEPNSHGDKGVAALLFNTKGGDLLYLDKPADMNELKEDDHALYRACGIEPKPFQKVRYYAPYDRDGRQLNTLRRNAELEGEGNPTEPFTFGLKEAIKHVEVLLNRDDLDAKADAYLQYLNDRFIEGSGGRIGGQGDVRRASNIRELCEVIEAQLRHAEQNGMSTIDSHSPFTVRKMYNRISNLSKRFGGLIADREQPSGPLVEGAKFEPDTVYVIDVAQLASDEQDLAFAGVITKLRERMEDGDLGVGRLVVMVDELNKYAPTSGHETYVLKSLREIAARGRYLGLTLFGAQQFRSRVDKEIVGNAATHAFGHVEAEELAQPGYSYFSPAIKEKLGALSPGEVLIKHPHFAQPIFIRFPRPSCMKGSDGMKRYPRSARTSAIELVYAETNRLGLDKNAVKDALQGVSQEDEALGETLRKLRRLKKGEDGITAISHGKKPVGVPSRMESRSSADEVDPFE
jgi:hypothetical protein